MRLASYRAGDQIRLGALVDGGIVDLQSAAADIGMHLPSDMRGFIASGPAGLATARRALRSAAPQPLEQGSLCAPLTDIRKNVVAVGRNYRDHVDEAARAHSAASVMPDRPVFFTKPPTAVIGHESAIELDSSLTSQLDYEAELVIVIGARGRNIPRAKALDFVFGYTVGNDVSARDVQQAHLQWFKGKAMDTFCPLGPCIVPRQDLPNAQDLSIELRVNGEPRQSSRTSMMIFDLPAIIAELSAGLTLELGDIIMTGTPSGVGMGMTPQRWLQPGDVIEAEIEGIGLLRNRVELVSAESGSTSMFLHELAATNQLVEAALDGDGSGSVARH